MGNLFWILSIDGGGIRGIFAAQILKRIQAESYGLTDRKLLETILNYLVNNQKLGGNDPCFCESGKNAKKSRLEMYNDLRSKGSPELFKKDLGDLKKDTKAQDEKSLNDGHFKSLTPSNNALSSRPGVSRI